MKRIIALIILSIGFNLCFGANTEDKDKQQPASSYQPIGVKKDPPNFHRSLEAPIFAYYAVGTINLDFVENLGAATVAVQNLTSGGQVVELIDTGMGNVVIDINSILTVGDYYMTITTMSGEVYYAEFTLE